MIIRWCSEFEVLLFTNKKYRKSRALYVVDTLPMVGTKYVVGVPDNFQYWSCRDFSLITENFCRTSCDCLFAYVTHHLWVTHQEWKSKNLLGILCTACYSSYQCVGHLSLITQKNDRNVINLIYLFILYFC